MGRGLWPHALSFWVAAHVLAQDPCVESGVVCASNLSSNAPLVIPRPRSAAWRRAQRCPPETSMATIEDLWPDGHFRGPLFGPRRYLARVPPHFLGRHANFSRCRRRVFIDVGAQRFESGMLEMFKVYPQLLLFDEFYSFEAVGGKYALPAPEVLTPMLAQMGMPRAESFARRHLFMQAFVGARSSTASSPPTIGLSDFLQTTMRLQPADAVVVKMDAEGHEYDIMRSLLDDGTHALIDELFVEVHYNHPRMMQMFHWCSRLVRGKPRDLEFWCRYTLENATNLLQAFRDAGVYTHYWP